MTGSSGRQLPVLPQLVAEQGPGLTSLELKQMGRDTIAGLIAGILQKYTKREVRHWDHKHRLWRRKCVGQFIMAVSLFRPLRKR